MRTTLGACATETMCGRCASSRDIQGVRHACAYRPKGHGGGKAVKPTFYQCSPLQYYPSYNISPQANMPVLLSGHHPHILEHQRSLQKTGALSPASEERVLQTMKWGLIPNWHQGSPSSFGTVLNNCRWETILEKPSFRNAVVKGRRCVVLADGFFEWYRGKGQRQPYFIYFTDNAPSAEMVELESEEDREVKAEAGGEAEDVPKKRNVWEHPTGRMLTMAGLFDICKAEAGDPLFTFTVITVEAHPKFAQIHHRMPAILDGQGAVQDWLDPSRSTKEACVHLHPVDCLHWHTVSTVVNNSRNHSAECVIPFDTSKQVSGQNTLLNWFTKSPQLKSPPSSEVPSDTPTKRPRLHHPSQ